MWINNRCSKIVIANFFFANFLIFFFNQLIQPIIMFMLWPITDMLQIFNVIWKTKDPGICMYNNYGKIIL